MGAKTKKVKVVSYRLVTHKLLCLKIFNHFALFPQIFKLQTYPRAAKDGAGGGLFTFSTSRLSRHLPRVLRTRRTKLTFRPKTIF